MFKRQRCEALAEKEQHEWELPDELASYANKYPQKFVQDKNLKDSILNENQSQESQMNIIKNFQKKIMLKDN